MTDEIEFYRDSNISVTNRRFVCFGETYAVRNITSCAVYKERPTRWPGVVLAGVGFLLILNGEAMLIAALMVIAGLAWVLLPKDTYHVYLHTSAGERSAVSAKNSEFAFKIADAVSEAVAYGVD